MKSGFRIEWGGGGRGGGRTETKAVNTPHRHTSRPEHPKQKA